ncbi:hypothetical protein FACS1894151_11730 [Spirochaetia bacterium]|nr:hypothetical protein FACS1894151_11730 [Spirochaetia bacterium]
MQIEDFYKLFQQYGRYTLPVLIELKHPGYVSYYFTNNDQDVLWEDGHTYLSTTLTFIPPSSSGGRIEITISDENLIRNDLLRSIDEWTDQAEVIVHAVIMEDGGIHQIGQMSRRHGTVNWDGEKIVWNMGEDDRLQMQINPWVFDDELLIN